MVEGQKLAQQAQQRFSFELYREILRMDIPFYPYETKKIKMINRDEASPALKSGDISCHKCNVIVGDKYLSKGRQGGTSLARYIARGKNNGYSKQKNYHPECADAVGFDMIWIDIFENVNID